MELKGYQRAVLKDLEGFLDAWSQTGDAQAAWQAHWQRKGEDGGRWQTMPGGAPNVCFKVPTGGGKTFLAACALRKIFDCLPGARSRLVVWLVPSEAILSQTLKNLGDPDHPYRRRLERDFRGRVGVLDKAGMLAGGDGFNPESARENLTVGVFCYSSVRVDPKKAEDRKIYQENGNLREFAAGTRAVGALLPDTDATALVQAIRGLRPVVVVDESHNAGSPLTRDMLSNLNPAFVLSLTATPRKDENIVARVDARALQRERMVKLPVIVCDCRNRGETLRKAVALRARLEAAAQAEKAAGGKGIRPIALVLAEPRRGDGAATHDKARAELLALNVPPEWVAVKTAEKDELKGVDLMDENCPVRFVVSVNALKEGWDCPFAYVLAALGDRKSPTEVEQVLGRVLRQPFAREHGEKILNMSYVFSCGGNFRSIVDNVVKGLEGAGFSGKEWRAAETPAPQEAPPPPDPATPPFPKFRPDEGWEAVEGGPADGASADGGEIEVLVRRAVQEGQAFERENEETEDTGMGSVKRLGMNPAFAQEARGVLVPQFLVREAGLDGWGGEDGDLEWTPLESSHLSEGFSLTDKDAHIAFNAGIGNVVRVGLAEDGDPTPKISMLDDRQQGLLNQMLERAQRDGGEKAWIGKLAETVAGMLDRDNQYPKSELRDYVRRALVSQPEAARREIGEGMVGLFARCVADKIGALARAWRRQRFDLMLDTNAIRCEPHWRLPETIAPNPSVANVEKALYEAEWGSMNGEEMRLAMRMAGVDGVRWWHRLPSQGKQAFCINGWRRHYPDFMVMTKKGNLVLVEFKGPHLDGRDSAEKCEMGRRWAAEAGPKFKYFMVYPAGAGGVPGALDANEFLGTLGQL